MGMGLVRKGRDGMRRTVHMRSGICSSMVFPVVLIAVMAVTSGRWASATMPAAPIEVSLDVAGPVTVGTAVALTLRARPLIDAPRISLTITLPEGLELVSGDTVWEGAAAAGEVRTLTVTVRLTAAAPVVVQGAARVKFPDGTTLGDVRSLTLPLGERAKTTPSLPPTKKTGTGESVIEYRDTP